MRSGLAGGAGRAEARPRDEKQLAELISRFRIQKLAQGSGTATQLRPGGQSPARPRGLRGAPPTNASSKETDLARWVKDLERPSSSPSTPRRRASTRCRRGSVGMSFSVARGPRRLPAACAQLAGAPNQLGVERALAILKQWSRAKKQRKVGPEHQVRPARARQSRHRLDGHRSTDTLLESYVLESKRATTWTASPPVISAQNAHLRRGDRARVSGAFLRAGRCRPGRRLRRRGRRTSRFDHHALLPKSGGREKLSTFTARSSSPAREVLFRMERDGVLIDAAQLEAMSPRIGTEKCSSSKPGPTGNRGSPSISVRRNRSPRSSSKRKEMPRHQEDAFGRALDRRGRAERLALDHPLAKILSINGESPSSSPPTRTSAEDGESAHGQGATNYAQATR